MADATLAEKIKKVISEHKGEIKTEQDLTSFSALMMKNLIETALEVEMDNHLGYEKHAVEGYGTGNSRNGHASKTLKGDFGEVELNTPRDRLGTFEPQLVKKNQTRVTGIDEKILALYARGMTTRDIAEAIKELYGAEVSHSTISAVTDAVLAEVKAWQDRPLERLYPILYLDCMMVKVHHERRIINKAVYVAMGVNLDGQKEVLGLWISENEGAKFWLSVLTELKNRGVEDIFITCVDGLTGFPDAISATFPKTQVQLCIVHMVRNSLKYVSFKDRKAVAHDLKRIYQSVSIEHAQDELAAFSDKWDAKYAAISRMWNQHWDNIVPFFQFPPEIRKVIYTTNAIESLNSVIRKAIKLRKIFPNDQSARKVIYLAIDRASKKWTMPIRDWAGALNCFSIEFEGRI